MALSSLFSRSDKPAKAEPPSKDPGGLEDARKAARRRLIGAVVLLGVGVIAFPLLFETAPRPVAVDLPIDIPSRDTAAPLVIPPAVSPAAASRPQDQEPEPPPTAPVTERASPTAPVAQDKPVSAQPAGTPSTDRGAQSVTDTDAPLPRASADAPGPAAARAQPAQAKAGTSKAATAADDGARARALLEGRAQVAAAGRWVVQIGAFAEERTIRDVRARVGKLGLETYTQVVAVSAGKRTRVRVGPFGDRAQADAVVDKLKKAGLPATVLKL